MTDTGPIRVLVTGSTGRLGGYVLDALARDWPEAEVIGLSRRPDPRITSHQIDLTDAAALVAALADIAPTHILHLAAASRPDAFDRDAQQHEMINTDATRQLAYFADTTDAKLIFASSDFVFDGTAGKPYCEDDRGNANHPYGLSKLKAERHVLAYGQTVVRLSLLHDPDNPDAPINALLTKTRRSGRTFTAAADEVRTPLHFKCAARAIVGLAQQKTSGVFHICGPQAMSAATLFHYASDARSAHLIRAARRTTTNAQRPTDVALHGTRLNERFGHLRPKHLFPQIAGLHVVVLVHNGASTLKSTLYSLSQQTNLRDLSITIACNGCTDASVQIARSVTSQFAAAKSFEVNDLPALGRNATLSEVVGAAPGPVVAMDQDARLTPDALAQVAHKFDRGADYVALRSAARPSDNRIVTGYHRTWNKLSYVRRSPATAGVYAARGWVFAGLSSTKTALPDDKFVRLSVIPERRALVDHEYYQTDPQQNLGQLIKDRTRYDASQRHLVDHFRKVGMAEDVPRWSRADLWVLLRNPLDAMCFSLVGALSILRRLAKRPLSTSRRR